MWCRQFAHTRCCCCVVCRHALRMDPPAKRSHHSAKVSSACPGLPRAAEQGHCTCSHRVLLACAWRCGQLRASCNVCRSSASSAGDGPHPIQMAAIGCAAPTGMSVDILPQLLQQPLLRPRPLRLRRCSLLMQAIMHLCRPSSVRPSSCYRSKVCREETSRSRQARSCRPCAAGWIASKYTET